MVAVVSRPGVDSGYAWRLALVSAFCICLGGGSIYLPVVALKEIAAEFGDRRSVPSLAYLLGFFCMGVGGVVMGWLADRTSPRVPLMIAGVSIVIGGFVASSGGELALYVGYALPLGFLGNAATFTPAMNNVQGWFERRRSTAVSIISAGPAFSGFVWPQVYRWLLPDVGWRQTLMIYGVIAGTLLFACAFYVRPAPVVRHHGGKRPPEDLSVLPMPSLTLMGLLSAAGFCCCIAMAMPFVHMVAFCGDLGFSAARGAEAVSLILATAVASVFAMGRLSDFIGPLRVSILCSLIQITSLVGFVFVDSLMGIYTLSIVLGIPYIAIVQGYALILRQLYGPTIAGWRLGVIMLFAMAGMAVGGWMGGAIFDATLSYRAAFQAALAFNVLNLMLLGTLYFTPRRRAVSLP
ncbi:MFS transporter [Reyranella soli]|uniref:MFS transporter n=1 Tax=Reyranella soli TaxID=1230389 RepID=A0A512NGC5_9HYPH|nr:MFS transporter [Reyranella soli]